MLPPNPLPKPSLRALRLAELQAMEPEEIRALIARIRQSHQLPKLVQHFSKHRGEFEGLVVGDLHGYLARMILHLRNPKTRIYTFFTTKVTRHRMWAIVDMDTGMIVQYNETRGRLWSFYRHIGIEDFLLAVQVNWVQVIDDGKEIELI